MVLASAVRVQVAGGPSRNACGVFPRVVAVVLNWNAWSDTIACVESLLASSRVPDRIVICDNGSVDGSIAQLRAWGRDRSFKAFADPGQAFDGDAAGIAIVLIPLPDNGGYAHGNNVGMRYAIERSSANFVWILNNDTVVEREALQRALDVATVRPNAAIVGSQLLRFEAPETIQAMGGGYIYPVLCHDSQLGSGKKSTRAADALILDHVIGASLFVRVAAIRDVGFIDESYFLYREETDWCIRMRRAGWALYCAPKSIVWHKQSHSIGFKSPLHDYYSVRNMLRLVWKFYPAFVPVAFGYHGLRSTLPKILRLEFVRLGAVVRAFADFALGRSGRAADHTERVLMRSYIAGVRIHSLWPPAFKLAGALAIMAFILTGVPPPAYYGQVPPVVRAALKPPAHRARFGVAGLQLAPHQRLAFRPQKPLGRP